MNLKKRRLRMIKNNKTFWQLLKKEIINIVIILTAVLLLLFLSAAQAKAETAPLNLGDLIYSEHQQVYSLIAYREGRKIGFPEIIQALIHQETLVDTYGDGVGDKWQEFGKKVYGIAQVRIPTAREMLERYPDRFADDDYDFRIERLDTDEELLLELITNHAFNIRVASVYFYHIYHVINKDETVRKQSLSIAMYNYGIRYEFVWEDVFGKEQRLRIDKMDRIYIRKLKYVDNVYKLIWNTVRPFNNQWKKALKDHFS